jgi:hypothetical protein
MAGNQGNDMKGTRPDPKVADPNKDVVSTHGQEDAQAGNQQSGGQQSGQQDLHQGGNADTQRANR